MSDDATAPLDHNPLFVDDLILPEQYFAPKGWRTAEQELASAQLMDAIEILTGKRAAKRYQWERDKEWLLSDAQEPMDFLWICRVLDLNHFAVRECTLKNLVEPVKRKPKGNHKLTDEAKAKFIAFAQEGRMVLSANVGLQNEIGHLGARYGRKKRN